MKVPRLKDNQYVRGPDYFGCYNTGLAPTIRKAVRHACIFGQGKREVRYVVGPDLWASEVARDFRRWRNENGKSKRIYRNEHGRVAWMYRTRQAAVDRFSQLVAEVSKQNEADRTEALRLKEKADKGDLEAALALGDMI